MAGGDRKALVLVTHDGIDRHEVRDVLCARWPAVVVKSLEHEEPTVAMVTGDAADLGRCRRGIEHRPTGCVSNGAARRSGNPPTPPRRPRRTYHEALDRFSYDYLPTLKPRTQERYRTSFRQLNAGFGNLYLDEITRGRLADYAGARMQAGAKGATVRRDLATLSCLCSCASHGITSTSTR
jgi:hypothetical protein